MFGNRISVKLTFAWFIIGSVRHLLCTVLVPLICTSSFSFFTQLLDVYSWSFSKVLLVWWQVGADIVKRALSYPLKLIAKNAGVNGSVVSEKVHTVQLQYYHSLWNMNSHHDCLKVQDLFDQVLSSDNYRYGYNAATGNYEDLMAAGIIDPTKVSSEALFRLFKSTSSNLERCTESIVG